GQANAALETAIAPLAQVPPLILLRLFLIALAPDGQSAIVEIDIQVLWLHARHRGPHRILLVVLAHVERQSLKVTAVATLAHRAGLAQPLVHDLVHLATHRHYVPKGIPSCYPAHTVSSCSM